MVSSLIWKTLTVVLSCYIYHLGEEFLQKIWQSGIRYNCLDLCWDYEFQLLRLSSTTTWDYQSKLLDYWVELLE